jgi:hypothetical protein
MRTASHSRVPRMCLWEHAAQAPTTRCCLRRHAHSTGLSSGGSSVSHGAPAAAVSNVLRGTSSGCSPERSEGDSREWPCACSTCVHAWTCACVCVVCPGQHTCLRTRIYAAQPRAEGPPLTFNSAGKRLGQGTTATSEM